MIISFTGVTLIDITDSGDHNPRGYSHEYRQAQNLNSLTQTLSMRTQLLDVTVRALEEQDLSDYAFGVSHSGMHTVWEISFSSEIDAWKLDDSDVYYAEHDVHHVPAEPGLDETIKYYNNIMVCYGEGKNIYFNKTDMSLDGAIV